MITYYDILGLSPNATPDEIRNAYRALAKQNHPDLLQQNSIDERISAEEKLKAINEAYGTLSQPQERKKYLFVMGTSQDPARVYLPLFSKKPRSPSPEDNPSTPPDPNASIHLKIYFVQNEITFPKTPAYYPVARF